MRRLSQDARRGHKACGSRGALLPLGHRSGRMAFLVAIRTAPAGKVSTSLPMMTSHMKPYITSEQRPDGGRYLPLQLQRAQLRKLAALLRGRRLLACKFPKMQTARSAWQVILIFDPDMSLELTSFSTGFSDRRRRGGSPGYPGGLHQI